MQRYCVCGKPIAGKRHICPECESIYGNRCEWPKWLKFQVNDTEREYEDELRIAAHEDNFDDIEKRKRHSLLDQFDEDGLLILRT